MYRKNDHYGIPDRQFVSNVSKAQRVTTDALAKVKDAHVRMSLDPQQACGRRREESIKFLPSYAVQGDRLVLKDSWTKGGKAREISARTEAQHEALARAQQLAGRGSLIPASRNWEEQAILFKALPDHLARMCLFKVNTGYREQEVCQLRWEREIAVPDLSASVFSVPGARMK